MRVVQTVFGVFHHFELARELEQRGHLQRVYSTFPWRRLRREGLDQGKVETFPWVHMAELLAARSPLPLRPLTDALGYANALAFDRWTDRRLQDQISNRERPDALVAISGSGLQTGRTLQRHGGVFVCDRGSTHQRFQELLLAEEYRQWGVTAPASDPRDTRREEEIYAQADAITVPSSIAFRSFVEMGVPPSKLHLIPYGVLLESFRPAMIPPPEEEFNVLFAGAVGLRKGVPYLLRAFAELQHPRKKLCIIGHLQNDLKPLLSKLPQESVQFLGSVPRHELAATMRTSHVLVLPSVEDGFGLVMAEAMACGCPVIASTHTGGEDLFTDEREGFIVPIRDPEAIAARLQQLADDPATQLAMRAAALRRVEKLGGWKDYGSRWESLLGQLTGGSAA